ncbi:hypothetical protein PISMIDRAFT_679991, partial [Pisolithus microcarpus 441]
MRCTTALHQVLNCWRAACTILGITDGVSSQTPSPEDAKASARWKPEMGSVPEYMENSSSNAVENAKVGL